MQKKKQKMRSLNLKEYVELAEQTKGLEERSS